MSTYCANTTAGRSVSHRATSTSPFLRPREVDQNVETYFSGAVPESPTDYSTVSLPTYVSVSGLSKADRMYARRRSAKHNPGLQATVWQGSKYLPKGYELRLPTLGDDWPLRSDNRQLAARCDLRRSSCRTCFTRLRAATRCPQIAETYDTRVSTLVALNQLGSSHRIRAGQRLRLPAAGPAPPPRPSRHRRAAVEPAVVASTAAPEPQPRWLK